MDGKKKKIIIIIGSVVFVFIIAITLFLVLRNTNNNSSDNKKSPDSSEQKNGSSDESSEENNEQPSSGGDSGSAPTQPSQQPSGSNQSSSGDNSNTPLCSRTNLSDEEVRYCADLLKQQRDEEDRRQAEASRAQWCAQNLPQIYAEYSSRLNSENSRYEAQIEAYVNSRIKSGAPGSAAAHREMAEKQYSPLHIQNVNSIVSNYYSTAQSHGCDTSGYSL